MKQSAKKTRNMQKKTRKSRKTINRRNKKQKGGFFSNLLSKQTKSKRELEMKCDLTNVSAFNDPFSLKQKMNACCPNSMFNFMKQKPQVCQDMETRYAQLVKTAKTQNYNINAINDPDKLKKIYQLNCPKNRFGYENTSTMCKELKTKYNNLAIENNNEIKQYTANTPSATLGVTYRNPSSVPVKNLLSKTAIGPYYKSQQTSKVAEPFYTNEHDYSSENINSEFTNKARYNRLSDEEMNVGGKMQRKNV